MRSNDKSEFIEAFDQVGDECHAIAHSKGWWDTDRNDGELIALMHSELSEMLDGLRHGNPPSEHIPDFSAAEEELADVVIRGHGYEREARVSARLGQPGQNGVQSDPPAPAWKEILIDEQSEK